MKKSNNTHKFLSQSIIVAFCFMFSNAIYAQASQNPGQDSLFEKVSIDELIEIKKYYNKKVQSLRSEEEASLSEGRKLGEGFLSDGGSDIENKDKIYIRVAEYYIEEAELDYEKANDKFDELFDEFEIQQTAFDNGQLEIEPMLPESPKRDYTKAIDVYEKLLEEYPASDFADDALYSVAWLKERMDEGPTSRRLFQEVIDKYPDSPFAPESFIQLAEYYFRPREDKTDEEQAILELRKAIQLYKKVLNYKDSKRYDEALYKLGWSYYKLAAQDPAYYNDAITYFVAVADDITRAEELDPTGQISNPDVKNEAIEYVGISFTDEAYTLNGVDKARNLIERKLAGKKYAVEIMRSIGETFQKIDEQQKAIYAFSNLLEMYPNYKEAPLMQDFIAKAVFASGNDAGAYSEREKLYKLYNPQSEWYVNLDNSNEIDKVQYLKAAYKNSEEAFRSNLLTDLEKANELRSENRDTPEIWERFGEGCKSYLTIFPNDTNTYDIHWAYALMLDQMLGRFEQAFEEYLTVSNDYIETGHQHEAALYAVGVADTIVKLKYTGKDSVAISLADIAQLSPEALTPEETNLIQAYDNYIRLFPNGEYTPNFLASAGGIYYNHKKFAEAKVYFQTLVRRFPGAKEKSLAMRSIMDSYFALGKFKDSEVIAKRILNDENIPAEQKEFASRRLAEAIFKNAEFLAEQGDFFASANEFLRLYNEVPDDIRYVEPALWNAGINFQKARDWVRSTETFDVIASTYPKSKFAVDALNNMVDNYKELEQFTNAAVTSERIFNDYPEIEDRESKLYNSSYFHQKAENWEDAIRVNNMYIAAYPSLEYSVDLFFKNAELYLKLDNLAEANRIYDEFAQRYPNDDRVVTAFYERGNYYLNNELKDAAKAEYNKAIAKSEQFKREGKESNPFIAGEAVNKLADILHTEFIAVELKQPQSNIDAKREQLKTTLTELNTTYSKVLGFGSPRSFEATYNIARSYEEFAEIYSKQEFDPNIDANKLFVKRKEINEQTAALYENAVNKYKEVVENIPKIAEKLEVDMFGGQDSIETAVVEADSAAEGREIEADSTADLANKWYNRAKDKISELLYAQASITSENVDNALNIEVPQTNPLAAILYKSNVYEKVIGPAVSQTIEAHLRNTSEAENMGLANKYVEESKRQILLTSNILANEYEELAISALDEYEKQYAEYERMIPLEFGTTNSLGLDYYGIENVAAQMIDVNSSLSQSTLVAYSQTLQLAQDNNIENDITRSTEEKMLRFSIEMSDRIKNLSKIANDASLQYQSIFDTTENYNYDDGRTATENFYFTLSDNSLLLLESTFEVKDLYEIKGSWANQLMFRLLELDPVRYAESIDKEKIELYSDDSWFATTEEQHSTWLQVDFDASLWNLAAIVPSAANQFAAMGINPQAIWVPTVIDTNLGSITPGNSVTPVQSDTNAFGATDSSMIDSAGNPIMVPGFMDTQVNTSGLNPDTSVFLRKTFKMNGKVVGGEIYVTADDDFRLYLNGEYLIDDYEDNFSIIDTLDFYTFDRFIVNGDNAIAVDVLDKDLTGSGFKLYGYFELVPLDLISSAETENLDSSMFADPQTIKSVNTLRKNRISIRQEK